MGKVLLKDISIRTGLSINTISRALKDKDDISIQTKAYVNQIAKEMGYIPDAVARSLRNGYTKTIGVMFDNISNPYFMIMTDLIHKELSKKDFDLMIFTSSGYRAQFDVKSLNQLIARRIDGIVTFLRPTPDVAEYIKKIKFPVVIVGREGDDLDIDSVYTNDVLGGYLAGEHLYQKGHKKVAYIGAPDDIKCSVKRLEGFSKYYAEQGIEIGNDQIKFLKHNSTNVKQQVKELVNQNVSAIFCFNDSMAYEAISTLHQMDINVPKQISIVGYDDIEEKLNLPIGLTTIHTDKEGITNKAIELLMKRIARFEEPLAADVFTPSILIRKTT